MNEVGFFEVSRSMIWVCFGLSAMVCFLSWLLAYSPKYCVAPCSKFVILGATLLLTLVTTVLLSSNVTLVLLLPLLIATRYRSMAITRMAVIGSCVISVIAPLLSRLVGAWGLTFMTGYLETVCDVSILGFGPPTITLGRELLNILMYVSLPNLMVTTIFGLMFLSITGANIRGMKSRLLAMKLDEDLSRELEHVVAMQDRILYSMADIVENRDTLTGDHVRRTSALVQMLVDEMRRDPAMELSDAFCTNVVKAAPLHDIGKIAVDDAILRKPGPLDEAELAVMRTHPAKSAELIHNVLDGLEDEAFLRVAENLAMYHHEWYNGGGYPKGLRGTDIPLEARIMSVADVFDALASRRSYKESMPIDQVFHVLCASMGSQFDPALEKYLLAVRHQIEEYYETFPTTQD